jgi:hypothetical protein
MADLGETFDPNAVPASEFNGDPLPAGNYQVQITESDIAETKSGSGTMLKLTMEVMSGEFTNRKLWTNLNIRNQNAQAQSIAQRALADIFQATGTPPSRNSDDLHFKPMMVRVIVKPDEQYGPRNEVKAYKPLAGVAAPPMGKAAPVARTAAPAARQAPASGGARPWAKPATAPAARAQADDIPF